MTIKVKDMKISIKDMKIKVKDMKIKVKDMKIKNAWFISRGQGKVQGRKIKGPG